MTQTEALKLALEALEPLIVERTCEAMDAGEKAITAIKEVLAQPDENRSALSLYESGFIDGREKGLKEAQRTWVGLTDEEIINCGYAHFVSNQYPSLIFVVKQLEAKLKEKNFD